jgi:Tfp pilus assembly protein PilN
MKIRLNVATRPLESHRRFLAGAAAIGVLGLLALVLLSISVYNTWQRNRGERERIAAYEHQLEQMRGERESLAAFFHSPQTKMVMDRAAFLNSLINERSFPWTQIFTDLETVLPAGVRVLSIAPEMRKGQVEVRLMVGADDDKSMVQFLEQLQKSPAFSNVQVSAETRKNDPSGHSEEDVQLQAIYSGAAKANP